MTPAQTFTIAALGGIAGVAGLLLGLLLSIALVLLGLKLTEFLRDLPDAWRNRRAVRKTRRADFDVCRAIDALPTTADHDSPR